VNKNIFNLLFLVLVSLGPVNSARSAAIFENSNFSVYFPTTSTQVTDALLAFGYFTGGFAPTSENISSWFNNFVGVDAGALKQGGSLGYYTLGADPDASVALPLGLNQAGDQYASLTPIGTRLSLIGVNKPSSSSSISGATEGFVITDTSWIIPTITTSNVSSDIFFGFSSGTSALVGFLEGSGPSSYTITMIPEPSSMSLMTMGLSFLLAFRRKTLVKRKKCGYLI
jgi:hypothetical protein